MDGCVTQTSELSGCCALAVSAHRTEDRNFNGHSAEYIPFAVQAVQNRPNASEGALAQADRVSGRSFIFIPMIGPDHTWLSISSSSNLNVSARSLCST